MTFLVFGGNVSIHLFNNCFSTYFEPDSVSDTEDTAGNKADNNCGPHCASRKLCLPYLNCILVLLK